MAPSAALIYANGIGDHLLTLPTVRALSAHFGGRLRLISFPEAKQRHYLGVRFCGVLPAAFRDEAKVEKSFDADKVAHLAKSTPLLISLNPWHSSSMDRLLKLIGPASSIGFHERFDAHLPLDFDRHCADMTFEMARVFDPGLRIHDFTAPPRFLPDARRRVDRLVRGLPKGYRVMAVHADTQPWKEWKAAHFRAALHGFLAARPDFIALVIGRRDVGLEAGDQATRVVPCHGLHLHLSLSIVERADLFLGVDSCALHMADLARTPGVGLFGATRALEWGFRFGPHAHVDCGKEMDRDAVDEVVDALARLADAGRQHHPAKR